MPLVIAQCSAGKEPDTQAAFTKYRTRNHEAIRSFMLDGGYEAGWDWSILSAEYGLVHPTKSIADYDTVLTPATLPQYIRTHGPQIRAEVQSNDAAETILFVGSKLYYSALCQALPHRRIKHIGAGGRGCGDYFSALLSGFSLYDVDA